MVYDNKELVAKDKAHVWHHITQHKPFRETDPLVIAEGKGLRV